MVYAREQIEIITTMVDNVTGASKRVNKSIEEVGFGMYKTKEQVTGYDAKGRQLNRTTDTVARGQHRFKMELLGVMFAGMALWRVTSGLIRAQFELFGITEMFGSMLTILFLPVMTLLAPILYMLLEYFMNLPEPVKMAISIFIILAALLGGFLMIFGQVGLAVFSIAKAFPIIAPIVKAVVAVVTGSLGLVLIIIVAIIAIIVGMYVAWKENFMGMRKFVSSFADNVKKIFKSLWKILTSIFGFFISIFKGDWDAAWEHIKNGFKAAWEFIKNILLAFLNFCAMLAIGVIRVFKWIVDTIVGFFKWLYDKIIGHSIIPDMINSIINWFWKLPNMIYSVVKVIANAFIGLGNSIINVWNLVLGAVGKVMVNILRMADKAIAVANKLPWVNIPRYTWTISWKNIPNIPYLAEGGIITKPTLAMLGERGAEKVVPLNKGSDREITLNVYYNINVSDKEEMEKLIRENNVNLVDEIKRQVAV